MAGKNNLDVTIDDREVLAMIEKLWRRVDDPKPLLSTVGRYIRALTKQMFMGRRPDSTSVRGEKWPKLAESTLARKKNMRAKGMMIGNPSRPLVRTAALRDDLMSNRAIKIKGKGLEYGTDRRSSKGFAYPALHQVGTRDGKIPARRWLFLRREELNQIAHTTRDYLLGKLKELKA